MSLCENICMQSVCAQWLWWESCFWSECRPGLFLGCAGAVALEGWAGAREGSRGLELEPSTGGGFSRGFLGLLPWQKVGLELEGLQPGPSACCVFSRGAVVVTTSVGGARAAAQCRLGDRAGVVLAGGSGFQALFSLLPLQARLCLHPLRAESQFLTALW